MRYRHGLIILLMLLVLTGCFRKDITITFDTQEGSPVAALTMDSKTPLVLPDDPNLEGHTFQGWFLNSEASGDSLQNGMTFDQDVTLYAKWVALDFIITYETNGGTPMNPETVTYGTPIQQPYPPTKEGFAFGGWFTDDTFSSPYTFLLMPAHDLTLYAKWMIPVTFEENGGIPVDRQLVNAGGGLYVPAVSRPGYNFDGWYVSLNDGRTFDERWSFATMVVHHAMTLYAKWIPNTYTLTFDGDNHDEGDDLVEQTVTYDAPYGALPVIEKTGYTFIGWALPSGILVSEETLIQTPSDHELVAVYEANDYTLTFLDGDGSVLEVVTTPFGEIIDYPESPVKTGFTFLYWLHDTMQSIIFDETIMGAYHLTLRPRWSTNSYVMSFETNGGDVMPDESIFYGTTLALPHPTKTNKVFAGWYRDEALETPYDDVSMPDHDVTIYALWHTMISFDTHGGPAINPIINLDGSSLSFPPDPTLSVKATFTRWYMDAELTIEAITTMPENNTVIHVGWQVNQYTITFDSNGHNF